jgi:hypothetical protein
MFLPRFDFIGQVQREIPLEDKNGSFARAEDLELHIFRGFSERPFRRGTNFEPFVSKSPQRTKWRRIATIVPKFSPECGMCASFPATFRRQVVRTGSFRVYRNAAETKG